MAWSKCTMDSLQTWLASATANTGSVREDDKFYSFIANVWNEDKIMWDETLSREIIQKKALDLGKDLNNPHVSKVINECLSNGAMILEFLVQHSATC